MRRAPLPCPSRFATALRDSLAITAVGSGLALSVACGSSTSTSVAAPSSTPTSRCQANVSSSTTSFASGGGAGAASITVDRDCTWSVATQSAWIGFTSSTNGQGDGSVGYRISANGDPVSRAGTIDVGDQHLSIAQEAAPCRYDVAASSSSVQAQGGELTVTVHTHTACPWTANSGVAWASVTPASGRGDAAVRVIVSANSGAARPVSVVVASTAVNATQAAATTPSPAPPPAPTPTPTPTPSPTPVPVPVEPIQLSGKAGPVTGVCPVIIFVLKERTIYTTPLTVFTKTSCDRIEKGMDLEIKGMAMSDGRVQADEVKRK